MKNIIRKLNKYIPVLLWTMMLIAVINEELEWCILTALLIINETIEKKAGDK